MKQNDKPVRVLYSFPHRLGATRICNTAWQQVNGLAAAGAEVTVFTGSICRPLPANVRVRTTLAWGKIRVPYRFLGHARAWAWHDALVARQLKKMAGEVDVVHVWPMGALQTLQTARELGIPAFLERPNAHTEFAYEVVRQECERLGITMPPGHEHAFNAEYLRQEEKEYQLADRLLCPSDFVAKTFLDRGFSMEKLARHQYGFDEKLFFAGSQNAEENRGLTMLFVGGCAPRKGLHYALDAWFKSCAHVKGTFLIAGEFIPGYAQKLSVQLAHPSVKRLGHRSDVPELMRQSDVFILPSLEEGSALVTLEARGSGCVLLVSEAAGAVCRHMENAMTHEVRDVVTLADQLTMLDQNRALLKQLRSASLATASEITWAAAGRKLLAVCRSVVKRTSAESET